MFKFKQNILKKCIIRPKLNKMSYFNDRLKSFSYAFKGIQVLFNTQANAQIHLLASSIIALWGYYLGLTKWEWCCIVICIAIVILAEAMNTALEFLTDLVSPEFDPLAGKVKDVAAGAVLLAVLICGIVWGIIFLPKLGIFIRFTFIQTYPQHISTYK